MGAGGGTRSTRTRYGAMTFAVAGVRGLTDPEVTQLVEIVRAVNAGGTAVIWIEHVVRALTAVVSR